MIEIQYPVFLYECDRHYYFEGIEWDVYSKYPNAREYIQSCIKSIKRCVKKNNGYWPDTIAVPAESNKEEARAQIFFIREIDKHRVWEEDQFDKEIAKKAFDLGIDVNTVRQQIADSQPPPAVTESPQAHQRKRRRNRQ